ncbi:MAG: hypothetical protein JWP04_271 [Belnapia sp.]|nr:hypothetical protein [Belnapia sp.]
MTIEIGQWMQAAGALAAVLLLILLAARALRIGGMKPREGRRLAVQEVLALDPRRRLLLLRCDSREMLVLTGAGQDTVLGWVPAEQPRP